MAERLKIKTHLSGNPEREPQFSVEIKNLDGGKLKVADPQATRALVSLMDMNAVMGGAASHYGGPAAFAEMMSALHGYVYWMAKKAGMPWHDMFHLVNDAGHCENGLYALKANYHTCGLDINALKKFRSIESHLTGHGEAHLFPEGVYLSNGPLGSAVPQAQGLAMADAYAKLSRVTVAAVSDGASMEGEAKEAFAAIPGFAKKNQINPFVLLISDNNTKLSGRIDKESFDMSGTFASFESLGWSVIKVAEGNNLQKCFDAIAGAIDQAKRDPTKPVAIHFKTVKGIGTAKTAESSSGGHGFPLKSPKELPAFLTEIYAGSTVPNEFLKWTEELITAENTAKKSETKNFANPVVAATAGNDKIQVGVSSAMIRARKNGFPVVSVTSDLPGSTGVAGFRKDFPADSFDVGVAESNMISVAAGFSKNGYIPFVDTFAQFGVTKGALPMTMAQLSHAPIIGVFSHTGFQDAADGASHQGLGYLAMTSWIPGVRTYCLTCKEEADALVYQAIEEFATARKNGKEPHTYLFFLGRENFSNTFVAGQKYELGKAQVLAAPADSEVSIVGSGSMLPQAILAANILNEKGVKASVVNPSVTSHPDLGSMMPVFRKSKNRVVVIEDHQKNGGFGQKLFSDLSLTGEAWKTKLFAVDEEFGRSAYTADDLYRLHRIDGQTVAESVLAWKTKGWN